MNENTFFVRNFGVITFVCISNNVRSIKFRAAEYGSEAILLYSKT